MADAIIDEGIGPWVDAARGWADANLWTAETILEIALILAAATAAWPLARRLGQSAERFSVGWTDRLMQRFGQRLLELAFPVTWLLVQWAIVLATDYLEVRNAALVVTTSLLTAWIVIRLATLFVPNPFWAKVIAATAWIIAALNIVGILEETMALLDEAAVTLGQVTISALMVLQGLIALGVLLWITTVALHLVEVRIKASPNLTPSMQVLSTKVLRIVLLAVAFLLTLAIVGVDLTALAVLGGAVGVGLGFGLQKVFANLVSGFILLLDKSIKPGDVIAVADYFGRVDSLGARYVSVWTRDGIEHLIPNEDLVVNRVENWSHSQNLLRLRQPIGVHYKSDVHRAIALCLEAARETPRILDEPKTGCLLRGFGDSSVDLELRFWIDDPMNGRANVTSEVMLRIWDKFHEHGIEIPYPQRDLHLRSAPAPIALQPVETNGRPSEHTEGHDEHG